MLESSYPPEVETDEEMSGTIGHALDRIVSETSRAPVFNKKLIFPRESVRVSELEEKQKELERAKKELEAARQKEVDDKIADPTEFKDLDLPLEEVVESPKVQSAPAHLPREIPKVQQNLSVTQAKSAIEEKPQVPQEAKKPQASSQLQTPPAPQPARTPVPATQQVPPPAQSAPAPTTKKVYVEKQQPTPAIPKPTSPVTDAAPAPETKATSREVVAYRRPAPARRRVIREVKTTSEIVQPKASDEDLEIFMKEAERVENLEIQCRADIQQLLDEIAERTGCSPEDLASQAVAGVAVAIKNAGFQFDLPMKVKSVRR